MVSAAILALLLPACTPDVTRLYAEERLTALAVATGTPSQWRPDAALAIAAPDLSEAMKTVVRTAVTHGKPSIQIPLPLGIQAVVRPDLNVRSIKVRATTDCSACFAVHISLDGQARWEAGPASGTVPLGATADAILAVSVREASIVEIRPKRIEGLSVEVPSLGNLRVNASGPIQEWLRQTLAEAIPPIRIATLDTSALPVRELRLSTAGERLMIEVLTDLPGSSALRALPAPATGVEVAISESAVTGLARRAAFKAGVLDMDVAADPRGIVIDGATFTMDLRLWRLVGRGWYRDYDVTGDIAVSKGPKPRLEFVARNAVETDKSPGALLVDPLAAVFQSRILDAIVTAMDRSLPAQTSQRVVGAVLQAKSTDARGIDDALHLYGTLEVAEP